MGACAPTLGFQWPCAAAGVNWAIPAEFYVPASPPWPEQLLHAVAFLQENAARTAKRFENCECRASGDWSVKLSERRITEVTIRGL
jgi:NADH:ubiquinone oxidoreductase subunit B-like Fe-S oxidoreductase